MATLRLKASRKAFVLLTLMMLSVFVMWINKETQEFFFPSMERKSAINPPDANGKMTRNYASTNKLSTPLDDHHSSPNNSSTPLGEQHSSPNKSSTPLDDHHSSSSSLACKFTYVDAFDPNIMKLAKKFPLVNCEKGRPWLVHIDGPYLKVNISKVKENPGAEKFSHCRYRTLNKALNSDDTFIYGNWSEHFDKSISLGDDDILIETECYDKSKKDISNSYLINVTPHHNMHKTSHESLYINHVKQFAPKESLNVLLVGIDGMSQQNFKRTMPKTREFLLRNMSAIELERYNKVGLNTCPNIMALLTGHHESFFKSVNWNNQKPLDDIGNYFLWSQFGKAGYRTVVDLEEKVTGLHYLKKGFYKSPADVYTRPMVLAMRENPKLNVDGRCIGDNPAININNGLLLKFATVFNTPSTPYFAFSFLTRLSHDDLNEMTSGEHFYLNFLQTLRDRKALNNTILIIFSDHGERYGPIRRTYNGIIEAKSPGGFIVLPEWFKSKYPEEYQRLQINAGRLTTVFDLHATLVDLLHFKSPSPPAKLFPKPGISLLQNLIPESRLCPDASIPTTFCNCGALTKVTLDNETSNYLSRVVTDTIMKALGNLTKDKCHPIVPRYVTSILKKAPPKDNFRYVQFSLLYEITVATSPGHGVFEAVVQLNQKTKKAAVIGSISRLDMYKGEDDCILDPQTRRFCFCRS